MAGLRLTWVDVFTDRPLSGNGLAVVHDADGLSDAVMLAFARETRLSETSFVQSADAEGADYRNRIFMPSGEVPFAGHPSLGAAVAVAAQRGDTRVSYRQQTQEAVQPIDVELAGRRGRASMLQDPPRFGPVLDAEQVLPGLGLKAQDLDDGLGVQVVGTGVPQVIVCVASEDAVARCRPDEDVVRGLTREHSALVVYAAHVEGERAVARGFIREGGGEDPATGSAAAPLLALAHARTGVSRLTIVQGAAIGRPSVLRCAVEGDRVRVGGDVVVLFEGTVALDI